MGRKGIENGRLKIILGLECGDSEGNWGRGLSRSDKRGENFE